MFISFVSVIRKGRALGISGFLVALWAIAFAFWVRFTPAFISDDAYFYLVIARNFALHGGATFTNLFPTNGVHPAWAAALTVYAWAVSKLDARLLSLPCVYVPLPATFLIWANINLARALKRMGCDPSLPLVVMTAFLSALGMLFSEAHLSYLALTCLALVCTGKDFGSKWHGTKLGLAAAFCFLARLDSVFLLLPLYAWYWRRTRSVRKWSWAALPFAIIPLPYLLYNRFVFGSIVPMSGWVKSTFPMLQWKGLVVSGLASTLSGYNIALGLFPVVTATLIIAFCRNEILGNSLLAIVPVFVSGALLQALFALGYSTGWWYWYYVLPMMGFALSLALFLRRANPAHIWRRGLEAALCACVAFSLLGRVSREHGGGRRYLSPEQSTIIDLVDRLHTSNSTIIVYDCAGSTAFYLPGDRIVPADMLMGNKFLFDEMVSSGNALRFLLDLASQSNKSDVFAVTTTERSLLRPNPRLDSLVYFNPKASKRREVIGQLDVGHPLASLAYAPGKLIYAWKISTDETARIGAADP
jgi:hypothetical protein